MKIYIAGPYTGPDTKAVERNVHRAIEVGVQVFKLGHVPYIPHLTHFIELQSQAEGYGLSYEDYMALDDEWLTTCDALLLIGSSPGANRELMNATNRGLVIYFGIDAVPPVV